MKLLAGLLLVLVAAAQPVLAAAQGASVGSSTEAYRLGTGDEVQLTIFGLESSSGTFTVGDGGRISIPLIGPVDADGKTIAELEAAVAEALKAREIVKEPSVTAQVAKYRPFYILGEVQKPGQYPYAPGMTVLQAVSVAGGYTFRANEKKATIRRSSAGASSKSAATPDTLIRPGDTVIIPEAWF